MFPKLLKLIIKSRFSWTYLLIILIFLIYGAMAIITSTLPTGNSFADYYFAGIFGLFTAVSILLGGLSMTQSDSEFLIVSAVKRRDLSYALYIGQYLYTGPIIFVAFLLYAFTSHYSGLDKLLIFVDVLLMSSVPVSLTVACTNVNIRIRVAAAAAFLVWVFSFKLGFDYSPVSMLQGHLFQAVVPTMIFSVLMLLLALHILRRGDLAYKLFNSRTRGSEYKRIKKYSNLSPRRAIFQYGFSQFEITTRSNFSGTPTLSGRRIRANLVLIFFVVGAIAYGYAAYRFNPSNSGPGGLGINIVTLLVSIYAGALPPLLMSGSTMPMERAWLSFTSMSPSSYMPMLAISKMIQILYLMSSFIVVDVVLNFLGVVGSLNNLVFFLFVEPLFLVLFMVINYRVQSYQIKDEKLITSRYSAAQFALLPPMLAFFGIAAVSSVLLLSDLFIIPILAVISTLFLLWKGFWDRRLYKLVETGFI